MQRPLSAVDTMEDSNRKRCAECQELIYAPYMETHVFSEHVVVMDEVSTTSALEVNYPPDWIKPYQQRALTRREVIAKISAV